MAIIDGFKGLIIPTGMSLNAGSASIKIGTTYQLRAIFTPAGATNQHVTWASSNNSIATVDSTGKVTPVSAGSCTITATSEYGGYTSTCSCTITVVHTTGVSLNENSIEVNKGEMFQLEATVTPSDTSYPEVTWSSSNTSIATVSQNGLVTYVGDGECTITVTTADGGYTDTCDVKCYSVKKYNFYYDFRNGSLAGFQNAGGNNIETNGSYSFTSEGLQETNGSNDRWECAWVQIPIDLANANYIKIESLGYYISGSWSNNKRVILTNTNNWSNGNSNRLYGEIAFNTSSPGSYNEWGIWGFGGALNYVRQNAAQGDTTQTLLIDLKTGLVTYTNSGANTKEFTYTLSSAQLQTLKTWNWVGFEKERGYSSYNGEALRTVSIEIEYEPDTIDNYVELEYIESTGSQYIDTLFYPTGNSEIEFDFTFLNGSNAGVFGVDSGWTSNAFSVFSDRIFCYGTQYQNQATYFDGGTRYKLEFKNLKCTLNGTERFTYTQQTFTSPYSAYVFAKRRNDGIEMYGKIKLYSLKLWDSGELVRDFMPAKRKSDGEIGLWDKVEGKFYTNSGTGYFIKGPSQLTGAKFRYIRNYMNGSNMNASSHYVELKAFEGNTNVALNKTVTVIPGSSGREDSKNLGIFVDNDTNTNNYLGFSSGQSGLEIDLGQKYDIDSVTMWHYYGDSRAYNGNILQLSEDGNDWITFFNSSVEGTYGETSSGKTISIQK